VTEQEEYRIECRGEYNVVQYFVDGKYEYTRRRVSTEEAVEAFKHYTISVGAKIGMTSRVMITDGDDCVVAEWQYGPGFVFPQELVDLQLKINQERKES